MNNIKSLQDRINEQADNRLKKELNGHINIGDFSHKFTPKDNAVSHERIVIDGETRILYEIIDLIRQELFEVFKESYREEEVKKFFNRVNSLKEEKP
jgi:hypothetical protein